QVDRDWQDRRRYRAGPGRNRPHKRISRGGSSSSQSVWPASQGECETVAPNFGQNSRERIVKIGAEKWERSARSPLITVQSTRKDPIRPTQALQFPSAAAPTVSHPQLRDIRKLFLRSCG